VIRRSLAGALLAAIVAGCAIVTGPRVAVLNGTGVPISVHVNGAWVGTVGPGASADVPFTVGTDTTDIEARSPTGAVLVSLLGTRPMFDAAVDGSMPISAWQDLGCGRLLLSVGTIDRSALPPAPPAGQPCP
jgi:hypothetical protein